MRVNEPLQERIQLYLKGLLPPDEVTQFEGEIEQNEELKDEVQLQREVNALLQLYGNRETLKGKLDAIADEYEAESEEESEATTAPPKTISFTQRMRPLLAIAAILVLVVGAYFVLNNQDDPQRLYAKHFTPYTNTLTVRGVEDTTAIANAEKTAMQQYENQAFDQAAATFDQLTRLNPADQNTYLFYAGVARLANQQPKEAIQHLQTVAGTDNPYREQAQWYIALAYLKDNDIDQAKNSLDKIANQSVHDRKKDAQQLLKALQ